MNKPFSEYVKSGAFNITLSERMIKILFYLEGSGPEDERLNIAPYKALERRGLAGFIMGEGFSITKEGLLVIELLRLANFNGKQ